MLDISNLPCYSMCIVEKEMTMIYLVTLINFGCPIYRGDDIIAAIEKAENAGYECSIAYIIDGIADHIESYSPISGWR